MDKDKYKVVGRRWGYILREGDRNLRTYTAKEYGTLKKAQNAANRSLRILANAPTSSESPFALAQAANATVPTFKRPNEDTVLDEAKSLVNGDRQRDYGHPYDNFKLIASGWSQILGREVSIKEFGLMMIWLKTARELTGNKRDNYVDIAGYADATWQALEEEARRG